MTPFSIRQLLTCRPRLSPLIVALLLTLFYVLVFNHTMWHAIWAITGKESGISVSFFVILCLLIPAYLYLVFTLLLWPWIGKPIVCLLLLLSAPAAYFVDHYHILINQDMLINVFETNWQEASSYFSAQFIGFYLLAGLLPVLFLLRCKFAYPVWYRNLLHKAIVLVLTLTFVGGAYWQFKQDYVYFTYNQGNMREMFNPYNYLNGLIQYSKAETAEDDIPLQPLGTDAHFATPAAAKANTLVVLVVGETTRAENFGLQGYQRQTTPKLAARKNLLYYPDAHSCGTVTFISVPCMFAKLGRQDYNRQKIDHTENVLDILQRAGVNIMWIDNDSGCKDVCDRVPHKDITHSTLPNICHDGSCYDAILLNGLKQRLAKMKQPALLVLHQKGSHGPTYYKRYPKQFRRFTPTCNTASLPQCSHQQVVNTYDNTIFYIDHILDQVIGTLQTLPQPTRVVMLYLSDHGESLGENGFYLHGANYATAPTQQTHIPFLTWLSPSWQKANPTATHCLKKRRQTRVSQDNLFDTLLGLFDVSTSAYTPQKDLTTCP